MSELKTHYFLHARRSRTEPNKLITVCQGSFELDGPRPTDRRRYDREHNIQEVILWGDSIKSLNTLAQQLFFGKGLRVGQPAPGSNPLQLSFSCA